MSATPDVVRMAVFADDPDGGNPAGVVLDAASLRDADMLRIAAEVGFSETAFVTGRDGDRVRIRYFSPLAEVPFCGHATLGTAAALASRGEPEGSYVFDTPVGEVSIRTGRNADGQVEASFTSVDPVVTDIAPDVLDRLLALLTVDGRRLRHGDLDPAYAPRIANAGNDHPTLVLADRAVFDAFAFDPAAMRALMDEQAWAGTVTILLADGDGFEARSPFPVGHIVEDPATGAGAAATGAYLRALGAVTPPARITIRQGRHVGRPGLLTVDIPVVGGITVTGTAVQIPV